jgi:hypothetical protein
VNKLSTIILLILLVFTVAVLFIINMQPKVVTLEELLKNNPPLYDASLYKDVTGSRDSDHNDTPVLSTTDTLRSISVPKLKPAATDSAQVEYYVIVESTTNKDLARQKADKLKKVFRTEFIILPQTKEGIYRISDGKYSTMEEARSAIPGIRKKIRSDAWIFALKR